MDFYSRPCGRGDPKRRTRRSWPAYFYSRPCGRGDKGRRKRETGHDDHFYSRPCGRGDAEHDKRKARPECISTHAPAGGATRGTWTGVRPRDISTHAPAGGATSLCTDLSARAAYFYSRPCGRGDLLEQEREKGIKKISTHAPAGGATASAYKGGTQAGISTHAPAGGATRLTAISPVPVLFLLTPLREGRPACIDGTKKVKAFLLTPLREGRPLTHTRLPPTSTFLLTPLREGRLSAPPR